MEQPSVIDSGFAALPAGVVVRGIARAIDELFVVALGGCIAYLIGPGTYWTHDESGNLLKIEDVSLWVFFAAPVVYQAIAESLSGRSVGKLICRLHVLSESGRRLPLWPAFLRNLAMLIDGMLFGLVGAGMIYYTGDRLGDRFAKSMVVAQKDVPLEMRSGHGTVWVGIATSVLAVVALVVSPLFF